MTPKTRGFIIVTSKPSPTLVLDLQGVESRFQGSFTRGAVDTEVYIGELREGLSCKVAAAPRSSRDKICGAFVCLLQAPVPLGRDRGRKALLQRVYAQNHEGAIWNRKRFFRVMP